MTVIWSTLTGPSCFRANARLIHRTLKRGKADGTSVGHRTSTPLMKTWALTEFEHGICRIRTCMLIKSARHHWSQGAECAERGYFGAAAQLIMTSVSQSLIKNQIIISIRVRLHQWDKRQPSLATRHYNGRWCSSLDRPCSHPLCYLKHQQT